MEYIHIDEYQDTNEVQYLMSNYCRKAIKYSSGQGCGPNIIPGAGKFKNILSFEKISNEIFY